MDRTSKRLSRALVLDRPVEFLKMVNDEEQQDQQKAWEHSQRAQHFQPSESQESLVKPDIKVPPPDRGSRALLFMISAFIIEAIMWGRLLFFLTFLSVFSVFHRILSWGRLHGTIRLGWCAAPSAMQAQPRRVTDFMNRYLHPSFAPC
jgi:hypothetical protein